MKITRPILSILIIFGACQLGFGQANQDRTFLKSKVLLSITRHVEWPTTQNQLVIGVISSDQDVFQSLQKLANERHSAQKIVIRHFQSAFEVSNCDMLFIEKSSTEEVLLLDDNVFNNTIIITEKEMGQTMALLDDGKKFYFQINPDAVDKLKVNLSDNLLALSSAP